MLFSNAATSILDFSHNGGVANPKAISLAQAFEVGGLGQLLEISPYFEFSAVTHGLNGIHENVHEHLLNLCLVGTDFRNAVTIAFDEFDLVGSKRVADETKGFIDEHIEIFGFYVQLTGSGEIKEA